MADEVIKNPYYDSRELDKSYNRWEDKVVLNDKEQEFLKSFKKDNEKLLKEYAEKRNADWLPDVFNRDRTYDIAEEYIKAKNLTDQDMEDWSRTVKKRPTQSRDIVDRFARPAELKSATADLIVASYDDAMKKRDEVFVKMKKFNQDNKLGFTDEQLSELMKKEDRILDYKNLHENQKKSLEKKLKDTNDGLDKLNKFGLAEPLKPSYTPGVELSNTPISKA